MPAADFCSAFRWPCGPLSPDSRTQRRSPEVSSTAFRALSPNLPSVLLMDMGFAASRLLALHSGLSIRFLFIDSRFCSTLPLHLASRQRTYASLPFTSIRLVEDFHLSAVEHARHTATLASARRAALVRKFILEITTVVLDPVPASVGRTPGQFEDMHRNQLQGTGMKSETQPCELCGRDDAEAGVFTSAAYSGPN
jgi:hypothetical protein